MSDSDIQPIATRLQTTLLTWRDVETVYGPSYDGKTAAYLRFRLADDVFYTIELRREASV